MYMETKLGGVSIMILKRKIEAKLNDWLESKYGLLMYGPRQVGKTYILNKFIGEHFSSHCYINLYDNVDAITTIINAKDSKDFILRISSLSDSLLSKGGCIFIDEIQEYYSYLERHKEIEKYFDLLTGIKFIVDNDEYKIVYSGSLLRLELSNVISNPVGYVLPLELYPLDFEEFLWANNVNQELIDIARDSFLKQEVIPDYIHNKFMDLFKKYILVGGMPQAVSEFIDKNSFVAVENAHKAIDYFIRADITKYANDNEKLKIKEVYNLIPTELNSISKRFIFSHIEGHQKNENESLSFTWLNDAGVTIPVYIADEPSIPLKISSKRNQLKLFHEDVGILTYLFADSNLKIQLLNNDIDINYGAVYENAVAELLRAHGFDELYYYNNKKNGEVDFLVEKNGRVIPLEIKSGKNYKRHKALNNLLGVKNYNIKVGYVFHNDNLKIKDNVLYFPIYTIDFLNKR